MKYKDFEKLPATDSKQAKGLGNGLCGGIEPISKGGGKYFYVRFKYYSDYRIGTTKKWSYTDAKNECLKVKSWVEENQCSPKLYKKRSSDNSSSNYTFEYACQKYIEEISKPGTDKKAVTIAGYRRQLFNQAMPILGADTPLRHLEHNAVGVRGLTGREELLEMQRILAEGRKGDNARKTMNACKQVFKLAIDRTWMQGGTNPALRDEFFTQIKEHHPSISWDQVPKLMEDINNNACNGTPEVVLCVKFMLLTFLRAGTLVRLKWEWIKEVNGIDCIVIPPETPGLKRSQKKLNSGTARPHHIPITNEIQKILDQLKNRSGWQEYVFWSPRGKKHKHLCPDAPNKHLIHLNYKKLLNAHGWRDLPMTAGQEVLGFNAETIQQQMGHLIGDKVRQAYDKSINLKPRRDFLEKWCEALVEQGFKV